MTLYAGSNTTGRTKLDGPERMLDALIGTIVWVVGLVIGYLSISSLYVYGTLLAEQSSDTGALEFGYVLAIGGGGIIYAITTLIFLVRLATGRRTWGAPLWGTIFLSVAVIVGYFVMSSAV